MKIFFLLISCTLLILATSCSNTKKAASQSSDNASPGGKSKSKMNREMLDNNTFRLTEVSTDESYGYAKENPVKVGDFQNGPTNERRFLNALLGPNGETVSYNRKGSCCPFDTPNGFMGGGLLDIYEVTYEGLSKPIIIYINMYDADVLKAPKGFKFKE